MADDREFADRNDTNSADIPQHRYKYPDYTVCEEDDSDDTDSEDDRAKKRRRINHYSLITREEIEEVPEVGSGSGSTGR